MTQTTSLSTLKRQDTINAPADMRAGFDTVGGFELMQRGAKLLASSTLVPAAYQAVNIKRNKYGDIESKTENPSAVSNCVLALNMSQRMGADPLMVMQNLYIVEGRPAWSSQFIIAAINACGKFTPLRFDIEDKGEREMEWTEKVWKKNQQTGKNYREEVQKKAVIHDFACTAWAIEKATNTKLSSPKVSIEMAVFEGWYGKDGSKWKTMPEVMLRYRAASFFGKIYAPELLMGIATTEEVHDTIDLLDMGNGSFSMEDKPRKTMTTDDIMDEGKTVHPETGEVSEDAKSAETPAPEDGEKAGRQADNKERAAQLAALAKLREETKAAWEATGAPLDEAEKLVNAFAAKWTTAQCQRIMAEVQKRQQNPVQPTEQAVPSSPGQEELTVSCPRREENKDGDKVSEEDCFYCQSRQGCPAWETE